MKFVSRRKEFRLIIRPIEVVIDEARRPHVVQGERVEFKNGVFTTEDKGLIDYLIHHPLYGLQYTSEIGNDPVAIQKYSMVFDDGATLSKPKIVAGFPEKNVEMTSGAVSTQSNASKSKVIEKIVSIPSEPSISKIEIEALIDSKLDSFLDKIGSLVIQPEVKSARAKPVHCTICGEEFANGFMVGKHKKEKHPAISS
jgi:hypothetical protein